MVQVRLPLALQVRRNRDIAAPAPLVRAVARP
jgi:hypothetical protein